MEEVAFQTVERGRLREAFKGVQDLDRIVGRVTLGTALPRDLCALARSLRALPAAAEAVAGSVAPLVRAQLKDLDPPLDVAADVEATLVDEPPPTVRDGGLVRDGVDPELDELRQMSQGGRTTIAAIEEQIGEAGVALAAAEHELKRYETLSAQREGVAGITHRTRRGRRAGRGLGAQRGQPQHQRRDGLAGGVHG